MTKMGGYAGTILSVDLSSHVIEKLPLDAALARNFIGGHGINAKLLYDLLKPGTDPLAPENVLIFGTGPLVGTMAPTASRATAMAKSPLSGLIGISNAGHFGAMLKFAGYDHLIIKGKAVRPVYLKIDGKDVRILDAGHLWGKDVSETTDALWDELGDEYWVSCIGQGGENLVKFAAILCNKHSAFGRTGLGAVMGSKNLKAVAAFGRNAITVADKGKFIRLVNQSLRHTFNDYGPRIKATRELGTYAESLKHGFLNFLEPPERDTEAFDFQKCRDAFRTKNFACSACPIGCKAWLEHKGGMEFGASCTAGTVGMPFGIELLLETWADIAKAADLGQRYGLDSIDLAAMISWAINLFEDGVITKEDTDGLVLRRGDTELTLELMRRIALREGFGDMLAEGIRGACQRLGRGSEVYANQVKGLGIATRMAYDFRAVLKHPIMFGQIVNPRGYHPDSYRFTAIPLAGDRGNIREAVKKSAPMIGVPVLAIEHLLIEEGYNLPVLTKFVEEYYTVLNSLGVCDRSYHSKNIEPLAEMFSAATGIEATAADLLLGGERIWNIQKAFNIREGATRRDDQIPERFLRGPVALRAGTFPPVQENEVNMLIDEYYAVHGWEKETGKPTVEKLKALGLEVVAKDLQYY